MRRRGLDGMQSPGDSGRDSCQELEPTSHHLQYHHKTMCRRGPNGMQSPGDFGRDLCQELEPSNHTYSAAINTCEFLAEIHVRDWIRTIITYSATISMVRKGIPTGIWPGRFWQRCMFKDWSCNIFTYSTTISSC